MSDKEYVLVQKITAGGREVDVSYLHSCAYIETASLDGVKLILKLHDLTAMFRDDFGIKQDAEIEVTFSDFGSNGDQVWIETFIVLKPVVENDMLVINAFCKANHELKQLATTPRFFNDMQPSDIISELCPDLKVNADSFQASSTYHLNPGASPSRLLRTIARDYGAVCYVCRGTIYFKAISRMLDRAEFKLEHGDQRADHQIIRYSMNDSKAFYQRTLNKTYVSWDSKLGMTTSGNSGSQTLISVAQEKALSNQHRALIPLLELELAGNTKFKPLTCCDVLFHKQIDSNELDETLPETQFINQVTHYQEGDVYICHIELGVFND